MALDLDIDLDIDVVGADLEFTAEEIGGHSSVTVRVSGETPGHIELRIEPDHAPVIAALAPPVRSALADARYPDEHLSLAGMTELAAVGRALVCEAVDDPTVREITAAWERWELVVHVGSVAGESLGDWAQRAGLPAARVLADVSAIAAKISPLNWMYQ